MNFKCISIFVYFLTQFVTEVYSKHEKPCKLNVILFFAKSTCLPKDTSGMKILDMREVASVKFTFPGAHTSKRTSREASCRNNPSCSDLLKETLTCLVHFCENALGMKTAVVSVSNPQITTDIGNFPPEVAPEIRDHFSSSINFPQNDFQMGINKKDTKQYLEDKVVIPSQISNLKDVITSPEHTEVFKIRVKRQTEDIENEKPGEIVSVPLRKENHKHPWDVLDIMSHLRFSFFGKIFEDEGKKKLTEEENKIADDLTQKKIDPGLFETVKTTLNTLQETSEEPFLMAVFGGYLEELSDSNSPLIQTIKHVIECTDSQKTLLVLTGACPEHLSEHKREHSHEFGYEPQRIGLGRGHEAEHGIVHNLAHGHGHEHNHGHKHEHDHKRDGYWKKKRQNKDELNVININEDSTQLHHDNATIPVYARGPEYEKLSQCSLLFDVPVVVKSILEQTAPNFEDEQFSQSRPKRSIFGDIRPNKENYENNSRSLKEHILIYNFCVFLLLII